VFILADVDVAVNNIKVFSDAMQMQQQDAFALLSINSILHTFIKNNKRQIL
jgi:hypothetical protein